MSRLQYIWQNAEGKLGAARAQSESIGPPAVTWQRQLQLVQATGWNVTEQNEQTTVHPANAESKLGAARAQSECIGPLAVAWQQQLQLVQATGWSITEQNEQTTGHLLKC